MSARLAFLGDTLLGAQAQPLLDRHGAGYAVEGIAPVVADADLVVANLEGPLTTVDRPASKDDRDRRRWWYRARPDALAALTAIGVRAVSLANNHVLDHGPAGLAETVAALDAAGVAHTGAGADEAAARRGAVVTVRGVRVGLASAMQRYRQYATEGGYATAARPGPALLRADHLGADLAATGADLRVALVHWGRTYRVRTDRQVRLAADLVAAGADLVVGHHPHVTHPVALVRGRPVLYSLGNASFGTPGRFAQRGWAPYGMVAVVDVEGEGGMTGLELRLLDVDNARLAYRPRPAVDRAADAVLRGLVDPCQPWRRVGGGRLRLEFTS